MAQSMETRYDQDFILFLKEVANAFSRYSDMRESADRLNALTDTAPSPFQVAIVGRMNTGKSTLINALIGRPLAIVDTEETTATINCICHGTKEQKDQFLTVWKDGRSEPYPIERLADWVGTSDAVKEKVLRLDRLKMFADLEVLRNIEIIDTPGMDSVVEEHETVIRDFLRPKAVSDSLQITSSADAIVYVVASAGREADADALKAFGEGRSATADPYNCIGVFHKWDNRENKEGNSREIARGLASQLEGQLKGKLLTVLPVSAPLALAARHAPDCFFEQVVGTISSTDTWPVRRWDDDENRKRARDQYRALPWRCFEYLIEEYRRKLPADGTEARERCLQLSHIQDLEDNLKKNFFANAMVIRQCQLLRKASELVEPGIRKLMQKERDEAADAERAECAADLLADSDLAAWAKRKAADARQSVDELRDLALRLSRKWATFEARLVGLQKDLAVLRELHQEDTLFPNEHHDEIRQICQATGSELPARRTLLELLSHYKPLANRLFEPQQLEMVSHLIRRIEQAYQQAKEEIV